MASSHWITVSTIGCCFREVNIFDSMLHKDLPDRTKEQIASHLYSPLKEEKGTEKEKFNSVVF